MKKKEKILIVLGIIFISFNLRAPITAVGSVIAMIKAEFMLSNAMAGFITTIPLLAFGIVSPFVSIISRKFGYGKTMAAGLIFILMGELLRSYTNVSGLFIGTTFIGIGIGFGNVLIPSIIKLKFPHKVGLMTSVYTTSMLVFAALGAGISSPLAKDLNLGWRNSLAFWFILTAITLLIWLPQIRTKDDPDINKVSEAALRSQAIWKSSMAWWVTLFMATQSFLFYSLVAWLPSMITSKGMIDSFAATMALTLQLMSIPATLVMPILSDKFKDQRGLVFITCISYLLGLSLLLIGNSQIIILVSVVLIALGIGGSISLAIAFISLRTPNSQKASDLSGMSQSLGYLLAALGPILMGSIFDKYSNWSIPILILAALTILLTFFGWFAGKNIVISE